MKTIILFLFSFSAFASSEYNQDKDKLKWLRLGYEVAYNHAPDFELAQMKLGETCEEAELWEPKRELGETRLEAPSNYQVMYYYASYGLTKAYYKCTKFKDENERSI